jgi:hypothetical protein
MEHISFSEIFNWLSLHRMVVWPLLTLMVLTVIAMKWWEKVRYFVLNVRYGFPWIGRVASAARKPQSPDVSYRGVTWYASERMVCADYHPHYRNLDDRCDPVFFEHCEDYLNKTGQLGRKEKGVLLWLATFALVIFEAVGFAYVLAPFMARNVSANAAGMLAWMIAFMLSIILVPLTDKMGQQLHKNTLLKKIRVWHADARKNGHAEKLEPNTRIKIDTTDLDNDKPNYIKILNRVDAEARPMPGWKISFITVLVIAAIAIGAYVIRSHTLDGLETEQVNASPFAALTAESSAATPFDLPGIAKGDNEKADQRAASERVDSQIVAYKTTFVILSVIFIGVQVFGILFGFFYSLAGEESAKASRYIRGFNNAREFSNHYQALRDKVARDAQARLATLQALVEERHDTSGSEQAGKARATFALYLQEKREQESEERIEKEIANEHEQALKLKREQVATLARQRSERANGEAVEAAIPAPPAPSSVSVMIEPLGSIPLPGVPSVEATPAFAVGDEASVITGLGDLTGWADDELADMATELGLPLERLQRKQRMQKQIAQAKHAQQSARAEA